MNPKKKALMALLTALGEASNRAEEALALYAGSENGPVISLLGMINGDLLKSASTVQGLHAEERA